MRWYSRRKPISTAMMATLSVDSNSSASADRKVIRRTCKVASRNWSLTRAMVFVCALDWPKSLSVVSP
ncbi:MAG: hypothetical protein PGMFKBFP_03448 [Anaerolineales bacterium]|nr:hypothetical protein [Anaerolineales bacterium]